VSNLPVGQKTVNVTRVSLFGDLCPLAVVPFPSEGHQPPVAALAGADYVMAPTDRLATSLIETVRLSAVLR
jgi:hypothetical protein